MDAVHPRRRVRFGLFEVDQAAGELCSDGCKVRLPEQPLQILQILLERPGEVVSRDELRRRIWPSDTFVDFDHGINNAIKRLREALGDTAETPHYIETLPRRGYRFIAELECTDTRFRSLLVLPLENLSRDPEQEYFADGLTEALITNLAKISALRVISRTTAMHYKGTRQPLPAIARELGVDAVIEGTVMRSAERVRISVQLIDARTDTHLWAESYERDLREVLTLQSEVANTIAREIQAKVTPHERTQLAPTRQVNPEAYEEYLKGRYYWNRRSREGHAKAVQSFRASMAKDPTYAPAYAGLADSLSILGLWGLVPPDEGCGKSKELALQAVAIDSNLAEGHTSLAWSALHYDYDFAVAGKEFQRSVELNSGLAPSHHWFGMFLAIVGHFEEAVSELKHALRLDPCSSVIHWGMGFVHWRARRHELAIQQYEEALAFDPEFTQAHWGLGHAYLEKNMYKPAMAEMQKACETSQNIPPAVLGLAEVHAMVGEHDKAKQILERMQELTGQRYAPPYFVAHVHAALGDVDEAIHWLSIGYREHADWMPLLKTDVRFESLQSDQRFKNLFERMKFP